VQNTSLNHLADTDETKHNSTTQKPKYKDKKLLTYAQTKESETKANFRGI